MTPTQFQTQYASLIQPTVINGTWGTFQDVTRPQIRYSIIKHLGRGGFGDVFLAINESNFSTVALKLIRPDRLRPAHIGNFQLEQQLSEWTSDKTRFFVMWRDSGQFKGASGTDFPYIAMEYVPGRTLRQMLQQWHRLPPLEAVRIAMEICEGLDTLHQNSGRHHSSDAALHRDLKPENLIFDVLVHGEVRIADLGVSVHIHNPARSGIVGTPEYIAPEIFRGEQASIHSDIYSMGCVLYEMLCGHVPIHLTATIRNWNGAIDLQTRSEMNQEQQNLQQFLPPMPHSAVPGIPKSLSALVMTLLQKSPKDRPNTAGEVLTQLKAIQKLKGVRIATSPHSSWPRAEQGSVVQALKQMASHRLCLSLTWLQSRTGLICGLSVRIERSLEFLKGVELLLGKVQTLIGSLQEEWATGFTHASSVEATKSIDESFRQSFATAQEVLTDMSALPAFIQEVKAWLGLATALNDDGRHMIVRNAPGDLLKYLFEVRTRLIDHQIEAVKLFTMATDRLLSEVIRK